MRSPKLDPGDMAGLILVAVIAVVCVAVFAAVAAIGGTKEGVAFFAGLVLVGAYFVRMRR